MARWDTIRYDLWLIRWHGRPAWLAVVVVTLDFRYPYNAEYDATRVPRYWYCIFDVIVLSRSPTFLFTHKIGISLSKTHRQLENCIIRVI